MINLITNYYTDKNPERQKELNICLQRNLDNYLIDRVILIISPADLFSFPKTIKYGERGIFYVKLEDRPTFNYYFGTTHHYPDDINIIANSDIYFNETLQQVINYYAKPENKRDCMALSRWDMQKDGTIKHFNTPDSTDAWIFNGIADIIDAANFTTGQAGCDNKINYLLDQNGYKMINPSKTIQAIHLHLSGIRNYDPAEDRKKIRPPFKLINPTTL